MRLHVRKSVKFFATVIGLGTCTVLFQNCTSAFRSGSSLTSASSANSTNPVNLTATRPSYNTGNGFFVLNGNIYDANGNEFRARGVDRTHYDSYSQAGIANSHANAVRIFISTDETAAIVAQMVNIIQTQHIDEKEVPIVTAADTPTGTATSCNTSPTTLSDAVAYWTSTASSWTALNKYIIVNIANEWGPANSTVWRDSYISAIASMRAAGYLGPLLIDAGGCGQDEADLENYAAAVFNSDPQKNIIFAYHIYGGTNDESASIKSIQKGNPTVLTLTSAASCHPFSYSGSCFTGGNNWNGITSYDVSGAQGMTQLNGDQSSAANNIGGTAGNWTITLNADSTNWPNYTGGGTIVDYNGNYALRIARLATLSKTTGAAVLLSEFGPGRNIGPSPTLVTPEEIMSAAEANNLGWLAWAWDDNDLANSQADNNWFSMTYNIGAYNTSSDLTIFGQQIVEGCVNPAPGGCGCPDSPLPPMTTIDPTCQGTPIPIYSEYGLKSLANPASIFLSQ